MSSMLEKGWRHIGDVVIKGVYSVKESKCSWHCGQVKEEIGTNGNMGEEKILEQALFGEEED